MADDKIELATGAVIYRIAEDHTIEYLLEKSKDSHFWGFAKGHVEPGETKEQAAIREIKEETNLDVTLDTNFEEEVRYPLKNGKTKVTIFYVSKVGMDAQTTRQAEEISAILWLDYRTSIDTLSYDNLKTVLEKADSYIHHKENF